MIGSFFPKRNLIFLYTISAIFLYETGPIQWMWMLMAWCFSTRTSVATVLTTHPCVSQCWGVNSSHPGQKWTPFCTQHFQIHFREWKILYFDLSFTGVFPRGLIDKSQHWFRLWLRAEQATRHYLNQWWLDYRRIYASLGLNELTKTGMVDDMLNVFSLKNIFEYWFKFHLNPLEPNQSLVITCNYQSFNCY